MRLFKKGGPEVIDLTELKEKGILQRSRAIALDDEKMSANENNIVDLTVSNSISGSSNSSESSAFGFLDSLAGAAGGSGNNAGVGSFNNDNTNMSSLKIKIEDIEYKLDRFIERMEKIELKLEGLGQSS